MNALLRCRVPLLVFFMLTLSSCMPDLRVENLSHMPECPGTKDRITFTANIVNSGNKTAGPSVLSFKVGGETNAALFPVPQLDPGRRYGVQRQVVLDVAQNYQNTVIADVNNEVRESNESNNSQSEFYAVGDPNCKPKCMPAPASDSVPPQVALSITYKHSLGMTVTDTVNTTDRNTPITVTVPANEPFTMTVASLDDGGVKTMALPWKYYTSSNQLIQPMVVPWDYSGCAERSHVETSVFEASSGRLYKIIATAKDFLGNTAITPEITVKQGL